MQLNIKHPGRAKLGEYHLFAVDGLVEFHTILRLPITLSLVKIQTQEMMQILLCTHDEDYG